MLLVGLHLCCPTLCSPVTVGVAYRFACSFLCVIAALLSWVRRRERQQTEPAGSATAWTGATTLIACWLLSPGRLQVSAPLPGLPAPRPCSHMVPGVAFPRASNWLRLLFCKTCRHIVHSLCICTPLCLEGIIDNLNL